MRIVYVAGFFKHVKEKLEEKIPKELDNRSVIWIPQVSTGEANVHLFKQSFFDLIKKGATDILLLLAVLRGRSDVVEICDSLIEEGHQRSTTLKPVVVKTFANARDSDGVLESIRRFEPNSQKKRELPDSLDGLAQWARQNLDGKLILHPRAEREAKRSEYLDVELVYRAVHWLGTEYREMRLSEKPEEETLAKLTELGLEIAPSISPSRAGEQGEDYFVQHGPNEGRRCMLDQHLKKGSDRDARNCLRIYFFWDDVASCVVVGWLPSHLGTRSS